MRGARAAMCSSDITAVAAAYRDVLAYADSHVDPCTLTVAELIFALQLPRATLYRAFEPHGGVNEFLMGLRLEAARSLLASGLSCKKVSEMCGFKTQAHFSIRFLGRHGRRPRAFKLRIPVRPTSNSGTLED